MKIAYNPLTADALTVAPSNNDITFDLKGVAIYAKGVKFKGTDTTYSVFKKHTSDDEGGYSGLVPVPSYNENSKNRYLREDGTWENPSLTIGNYVTLDTDQEITGTKTFTKQLKFTVATGTAPFEVTSNTLVMNLNADKLDNLNSDDFYRAYKNYTSDDLNTFNINGVYGTADDNLNQPNVTGGTLYNNVYGSNGIYRSLILGSLASNRWFARTYLNDWKTWKEFAWTSDIPTKVSQLENDSGFVTGGPYLPLTGGILSNDARNLLILHDTNSSTLHRGAWIKFSSEGSNNYTTIGLNTTTGTFLEHYVGTTPYILKIDNNGVLYFKDNTVLHSKNYSSYALPFYTITSGDCNTMSQGLTTVTAVVSNQEGSNHSAFLTITDIGTPFQLQIPDHSTNYIYKRYKSGSTWSAWSKLSAGYADSAAYATSTGSLYTGSIGSGSDSHASALQNYFNNYKTSIPRGSILSLYSSSYGNGSQYMGYFLNGYDDTPYGGFFVAHYDSCYYVGISYGNYNQQTIITSNNIGSQSVNYAEYAQKLQVNDVRNAARSPKYFDDYRVTAWFNDTGTPSSDWYSGIHVKGWHNGYSSWELASYSSTETDNNYDLYFRNGNNDTWGNWKIVLTDSNYTTYLDDIYVKKTGDTMTGGLTINASHNSAPLILKGGLNNYREGLRIIPYGGWSDILLAGSDASETSGTSTNSWFIGNNNGKLYINKGNSSEKGNPRAMGTSTGWTFGNTDLNSYALNTASFICNSWVRTKGPSGWYNEDYGGGWYMIDSTWIRNYNSKQTYLSVSTYPSLVCNAQSGNDTNIRFDLNGSVKGYVGYLKSYGTFLYNLASNKYVYINDSGYFYTQSYINVGAGNEKNASSPPYVWGVNGSDNFMRTYATSSLSVGYADRINSLGNKSASDLSSTYGSGLTTSGIYNNGWPFSYGCVITTNANGGVFQIAGQWNSSITGSNNCDYSTEMYIRNRRDSYDVWSTWTRVLTNRNSSVSGGGSSGGSSITVNIGGTSKTLTIPTSLPANGGNANTAGSAATLSGGSIPTWGTLTAANGYTNVCTWDTGNTTGAFSLAGKGGQMSLQLDGFFYQNEGRYLVLDTNNYSSTLDGRYVNVTGDTMTGPLTFANKTWNVVGDDAAIGNYNVAGSLGLKSINNNIPSIGFHNSSNTLLGTLKCDAGTLKWDGGLLKITHNSGTLTIGSLNTSYTHYSTTGGPHWFNKTVYVQGDIFGGSGYNRRLAYCNEIYAYALPYNGWWTAGSGQNVNDANGMTFVYGDHGSPNGWGILCTFDYQYNSSYKFQLFAEGYSAAGMYYRCRSADRGSWTSWKTVIDSGNIGSQSVNYATSAGNSDKVDGYHIWVGSQSSYNGLTKNSSTIYFII